MASLEDTTDPSGNLIAAHQVQGTAVFNTALEKLGRVEDVMLDKRGRDGLLTRSSALAVSWASATGIIRCRGKS